MKLKVTFTFIIFISVVLTAQTGKDSIVFTNYIYYSDGNKCKDQPPATSFMVFLNRDLSKVLIENAPRWLAGQQENIYDGIINVELGNFVSPSVKAGDSVFVIFTSNAVNEQITYGSKVTAIPWFRIPAILNLKKTSLPATPQNVKIVYDTLANTRLLNWTMTEGVTYSVYRRTIRDTVYTGQERNLYTLIAKNLTASSFNDASGLTGENYAYIIFATNSAGVISSHSEEVKDNIKNITGLSITATATNAHLNWNPFSSGNAEVKNYDILRREENGNYEVIGYAGKDTSYVDTRLQTGKKYFYKVKAKQDYSTELAASDETEVTTLSSKQGFYTYSTLRVAIVIYTNTNKGAIAETDIPKIKRMLELGRQFYWRNSSMKLNVEFDYIIINDRVNFDDPNAHWENLEKTAVHLNELGTVNTQYDIIFRITTATDGYYSYGVVTMPELQGPSRQTGFSWVHWPVGTGVVYPGHEYGINYGLTWVFVHECQHAIDAVYDVMPDIDDDQQMYHGDNPLSFPVACGEQFDFQAKMFRTFNAYENLLPEWGEIYEAIDADGDGFPDNDLLTPMDETRFGSSSSAKDSDNDGLDDKKEFCDGAFTGSNPNIADTDGDGVKDGNDFYPRYPVQMNIPKFKPVIDGQIDAGWKAANDTVVYTQGNYSPELFLSYDEDSLYVGLKLKTYGLPEIYFDFQNDGWWWGSGNTVMKFDLTQGRMSECSSYDAGPEVRAYFEAQGKTGGLWDYEDTYQSVFRRKVLSQGSLRVKVTKTVSIQIEIAIPKNELAGINLKEGDKIGMNVYYTSVNNQASIRATTFDQYSFAYFTIGNTVDVEENNNLQPSEFSLLQNYPNPFNPATKIKYSIPVGAYSNTPIHNVLLKVYDILGNEVITLVNDEKPAGQYEVLWNEKNNKGNEVSSGIYFYRLDAGAQSLTRKMILVR